MIPPPPPPPALWNRSSRKKIKKITYVHTHTQIKKKIKNTILIKKKTYRTYTHTHIKKIKKITYVRTHTHTH